MGKNKSARRNAGRGSGKRRGRAGPQMVLLRTPQAIVPDVLGIRMKYNQRLTLTSTSGSVALNVFQGNGLYDPDVTGAGLQPEGFDQMMGLYGKYRVRSSRLQVQYASVGTTAGAQTFETAIVATPNVGTFSTLENVISAPFSKWRVNQGLANFPVKLARSMTTSQVCAVPAATYQVDDTYSGTASANPITPWYWHVYVQSVDQSTTINVYCFVLLTFEVEFFYRKNLALS